MIRRALLFASLLPFSALAQLQVFEFNGTTDTTIGTLVNVGTAAPGDTLTTRFHVRNLGAGPTTLETLALSGQGFSIASAPSLPYILAPYVGPASEAEVDVDFSPATTGSFSAFLAVNSLDIPLQGTSIISATVTLSGSQTPLAAGAIVNFEAPANSVASQGFVLFNSGNASVTVQSVTVTGAGFSGPLGLTTPVQIGPGQSAPFQINFAPLSGTAYQGTLSVDQRKFTLAGLGENLQIPGASIAFASNLGASAQQNSITIPLASQSLATGTGTLTMAFQPSVAGVTDDAAIQFLSGPFRQATVTIAKGETSALIGGKPSMAFQTGTTAGTITFTLTLEDNSPQQATLTIPPSPINLDSTTAVRLFGSLNVAFSGFDNTYSASQLAFTFYDITGKALPQGAIDVDAASDFQQYFGATQVGGMFQVLATFPVTGNTAEIGFVTAQITNSLGTTSAQQIPIGN